MKAFICYFASALQLMATPLIVAHRGASHDAPENTLPAFELAWKQGADAIEGDFHLTADGKIVCIHDYDTARTTGTKKIVKDSTYEDLTALEAGSWFAEKWKGTHIPLFSEVAATVPVGGKFYVELKCGPEIVPVLIRELAQSTLTDEQVVIIAFDPKVIQTVKKEVPQYKAYWLSSFDKSSPLKPSADAVIKTLRSIGADGFSSKADPRLNQAFIQAIADAGFEYHCWTIDRPEEADRFEKLGAASITTNRPEFIRERLTQ
ncbi:glycerophosphodiester phosphodiesterase [Haloferula chungangensis]|uniref:Glycerophosphodiester phosphodiesterase n=1 Tax=Haloferula chungangensis TaxID=1048331 RepID=A0ABW2L9P7_9BACT